jgi:hypothetical protein
MSFFRSLFGWKRPKKLKHTCDKLDFKRIYEEAKELFLRSKYDQSLDSFKSIYEYDVTFRDVASIIDDYYVMPKDKWLAKYKAQFRTQPPKESGDNTGTGSDDTGTGLAPVPTPKRPTTPSGSFRGEGRPNEDDRPL